MHEMIACFILLPVGINIGLENNLYIFHVLVESSLLPPFSVRFGKSESNF